MKYSIRSGFVAGLIATTVLSIFMIMKKAMGLMPEMNPIADLATIFHAISGVTVIPAVAWVMHFVIGTLFWGGLFAVLSNKLPGRNAIKGILFGMGAWLLMMVTVEPMAGHGLFGLQTGKVIPVMSFMLHLVYGAILGVIYGKLSKAKTNA